MKESDIYFDDLELSDLNLILLKGHEHPLAPGTRDKVITIPNRHGALDFGADLEPISFAIPLAAIRNDRLELQRTLRQIKAILVDNKGKPKTFKLKFGYEPDKYYNVRYSGSIPIDRLIGLGEFVLPLICYDGHAWSVAKNDEITWGNTELTFTAPYTLGHSGDGAQTFTSSGSTSVFVAGADIKPVIHVSGSGNNVTIDWDNKSFTLGTFTSSVWRIDLGEYEAEKDGLNALHLISGDWLDMDLLQGDNTININGSDLNLTFSVEFRDRYF